MKFLRSAGALVALGAAMLSQNASAVNISTDGVGEVAIAPFYTTREGWQTTINLINTQNVPVVVKVRFHEALNSRDVLDFTVALSAFDVFTGVVREGANGQAVFVNTDQANAQGLKTCTIPSTENGAEIPLNILGFTGLDQAGDDNDDGGPNTADRLSEGYIEFIVEGFGKDRYATGEVNAGLLYGTGVPISSAQYAALSQTERRNYMGHAIETHDCATVRSGFVQSTVLNTARQFGEAISALKFNFSLLNPSRGTETGYSATNWSNFYNPQNGSGILGLVVPEDNFFCDLDRGVERRGNAFNGRVVDEDGTPVAGTNWCPDGTSNDDCTGGTIGAQLVQGNAFTGAAVDDATIQSCRNLITAQVNDDFLEPTLNDVFPYVANWYGDSLTIPAAGANVQLDTLFTVSPASLNILSNTGSGNALEVLRGVDALSLTIQRQAIINEWSLNPNLGVTTDWVVTQPTKAFYVDEGAGAQFQVITDRFINGSAPPDATFALKGRAEAVLADVLDEALDTPYQPYQNRFRQTVPNNRNSASACNRVDFALFDRAEQSVTVEDEEPIFSPAPATPQVSDNLCYEANLVNFADSAGIVRSAFGVTPLNRVTVQTGDLAVDAPAGWMILFLDSVQNAITPAITANAVTKDGDNVANGGTDTAGTVDFLGLPVIGVNIKTRNFPDRPDLSFSSSSDHSYIRAFNP